MTTTAVAPSQNGVAKPQTPQALMKAYFSADSVKNKFQELLGRKSQGFVTSLLQVVTQNTALAQADPQTVYQAAMMAATLDLPINQNLGFAYIIPYNEKVKAPGQPDRWRSVAQFQMGYKGYIQLAQRSGLFKTISCSPIYQGQVTAENPLTGFEFDFTKRSGDTVIGYAAYFELLNGFQKTLYMTTKELEEHGLKFSQTMKKGFGLWKDDFHSMALKTVLKLLLSKFAPLSIEMQKAVITDQAVINDAETEDISYIDNTNAEPEVDKSLERMQLMIGDAETVEDLDKIAMDVQPELIDLFTTKKDELKSKAKK